MVTLKQLAEQLNLSISTVSKALNDSDEIGKATTKRVKELAKHLNYRPNKTAVNLKNNSTKTIGVIIPNILNNFFAKVLYGIEKEANKHGFDIIICLSNEKFSKELQGLKVLANGSVDGFILSIAKETQIHNKASHFNDILNQNIPIVMFDRVAENVNCDKVIVNDYATVYNTTTHLLNEDRKKIVLISGIKELSVGKLRTQGYVEALQNSKAYKNQPIIINVNDNETIEGNIETLFNTHNDVDGIISIDNITGVIALNKATKKGYNIPKDLSIIGFSDEETLKFTNPKMSTVSQNAQQIGINSVELLLNKLKKRDKTATTQVIKTDLILRDTTLKN